MIADDLNNRFIQTILNDKLYWFSSKQFETFILLFGGSSPISGISQWSLCSAMVQTTLTGDKIPNIQIVSFDAASATHSMRIFFLVAALRSRFFFIFFNEQKKWIYFWLRNRFILIYGAHLPADFGRARSHSTRFQVGLVHFSLENVRWIIQSSTFHSVNRPFESDLL